MTTEYVLTLHDYLSVIRRRARLLAGIFFSVFLISIIVLFVIPPTYRATGIILVESQQISDNVVSSAIKNPIDEQISVVNQRVMTRENLLPIANKYNLSKDFLGSLSSAELIEKLRNKIFIETVGTNVTARSSRPGQQTTTFALSFEDRNPEIAFKVTNELIALFLHWNSKMRIEGASETTDFLTQESDILKIEVDRLEKLISTYKQQNKNALPEQLTVRMTMLARAENDLREVERDLRSTKEELRSLEVELSAAKRGISEGTQSESLPALKAELARISALYKESHPDIRRLKRKIETIETAATVPDSALASDVSSLAVYRIQSRIDSGKARIISLTQQREMLQSKISENERAMILTPKVGQELDVLIRDRDTALRKFEEFRNKQTNAKIAENLESENKSGRFTVLEPPLFPEKAFKPNRLKFLLLSFFFSLAFAVGVVVLLELIDKRIRGIEPLTHILGYRPLVSIPYFPSQKDDTGMKRIFTKILASLGRG